MSFNRVAVAAASGRRAALWPAASQPPSALGITKVTPDEFRVVTKAPLVLPPDYSLRPPAPGEPRPQELQPESAARLALLGQREAEVRSDGEKLLAAKAGADNADPLSAMSSTTSSASIAHKDKGFADWVMFWRRGKPAVQPAVYDRRGVWRRDADADRSGHRGGAHPEAHRRQGDRDRPPAAGPLVREAPGPVGRQPSDGLG